LAQKVCCPPQQLVEVHPNGAQNGIEPVAHNPVEAVAVHSVLSFQVPDSRLYRRTPFHPPPQALGGPPAVAFVDMDLNLSRISMPPVAHVHKSMLGITGNPLDLLQSIFQSMTVIRVPMSGHGTDKPPAATGGRHTDLAAKLITLVRLALADALHMGLMNTVDFLFVVSLLIEDARSNIQQGLQLIVRLRQRTLNISYDSSQIRF
jgi:hypothetical protein